MSLSWLSTTAASAAGIVGTELAARSAPDGYTIFYYGIDVVHVPYMNSSQIYPATRRGISAQ